MEDVVILNPTSLDLGPDRAFTVNDGPAKIDYELRTYSIENDVKRVSNIRKKSFYIEYKIALKTVLLFNSFGREAGLPPNSKNYYRPSAFVKDRKLFETYDIMQKHQRDVNRYIDEVISLFFQANYIDVSSPCTEREIRESIRKTLSNFDFRLTFYNKAYILSYMYEVREWEDKDELSSHPLQAGERVYVAAFQRRAKNTPAAFWFLFSMNVPGEKDYGYIHLHGWSGSLLDHFFTRCVLEPGSKPMTPHPPGIASIALSFTMHVAKTFLDPNLRTQPRVYMFALLFESTFNVLTKNYGINPKDIYRRGTKKDTGDTHNGLTMITEKDPEKYDAIQYMWPEEIHLVQVTDAITDYFRSQSNIGQSCAGCEVGQGRYLIPGQGTEWLFCSQECFDKWWSR